MPNHTISEGECLTSLAAQSGIPVDTIWNHSENAALKAQRKDQNVLYPGDQLFIPDLTVKEDPEPTDQEHQFVLKTSPAKMSLRLMDVDTPRANVPYQLQIDGVWTTGETDADGYINLPISPTAQTGQLLMGEGATKDTYQLQFGTVDPYDTDAGVNGRLIGLGYGTDDIVAAITAFQTNENLPVSGEVDDATRNRLQEKFGQ